MPGGPDADALLFSHRLGRKWPHVSHSLSAGMVTCRIVFVPAAAHHLKKSADKF